MSRTLRVGDLITNYEHSASFLCVEKEHNTALVFCTNSDGTMHGGWIDYCDIDDNNDVISNYGLYCKPLGKITAHFEEFSTEDRINHLVAFKKYQILLGECTDQRGKKLRKMIERYISNFSDTIKLFAAIEQQ